jgi:hypothetical protein
MIAGGAHGIGEGQRAAVDEHFARVSRAMSRPGTAVLADERGSPRPRRLRRDDRGSAPAPERAHLRLVASVDLDRVVGGVRDRGGERRRSRQDAGIGHDSPAARAQLERQRSGVSVARLMFRSDRAGVEHQIAGRVRRHARRIRLPTCIPPLPAAGDIKSLPAARRRRRDAEPVSFINA